MENSNLEVEDVSQQRRPAATSFTAINHFPSRKLPNVGLSKPSSGQTIPNKTNSRKRGESQLVTPIRGKKLKVDSHVDLQKEFSKRPSLEFEHEVGRDHESFPEISVKPGYISPVSLKWTSEGRFKQSSNVHYPISTYCLQLDEDDLLFSQFFDSDMGGNFKESSDSTSEKEFLTAVASDQNVTSPNTRPPSTASENTATITNNSYHTDTGELQQTKLQGVNIAGVEESMVSYSQLSVLAKFPCLFAQSTAEDINLQGPNDLNDAKFGGISGEGFGAFSDLVSDLANISAQPATLTSLYRINNPNDSPKKLQWNVPKYYNSRTSSLTKHSSQSTPSSEIIGQKPTTSLASTEVETRKSSLLARCEPNPSLEHSLKPFVRAPVPNPVLDRSPVLGLTSASRLITHFRLGAALNQAASHCHQFRRVSDIVELYARVARSWREGPRQYFEFRDLFHPHRPPILNGTWIGWQGIPYWELDGNTFLDHKKVQRICRVVGQIEKVAGRNFRMCILNVWEADWEDIKTVKNVICA